MFTKNEKAILDVLSYKYRWIFRDADGLLFVSASKPEKGKDCFKLTEWEWRSDCENISEFAHIFKDVTYKNSPILFKEDILDEVERDYLKTVFKPFAKKIKYVKKVQDKENDKSCEYIIAIMKDNDILSFPDFKSGLMYRGMNRDVPYTLGELGIEYDN